MIKRIDHVSLAVRDVAKARAFFTRLLGAHSGSQAADGFMKYTWEIFSLGDLSRLELISPTGPGSFLDKFLADKPGGVHHITLQTADIQAARARLAAEGIPYFGYNVYPGDVWKELFIHPRDAFGVLIQIAEFTPDDWLDPALCLPRDRKYTVEKTAAGCRITLAHPGGATVAIDLSADETDQLIASLNAAR